MIDIFEAFSEFTVQRKAQMSYLFLDLRSTGALSYSRSTEITWPFFFFFLFSWLLLLSRISSWLFRSLRSAQYHLRWRGREARARQTETVTSVTDSGVMEGENGRQEGMEGEFSFSFSPFSFPLADSEKLMKEQYDNLLFGYLVLSAVLSGLGRYRVVAELSPVFTGWEFLIVNVWIWRFCCCLHWHTAHLILHLGFNGSCWFWQLLRRWMWCWRDYFVSHITSEMNATCRPFL